MLSLQQEKNNSDIKENAPIGFFDSGVGGLSVYSKFRKSLPYENTIYYGDLKNLPYGNKSKEDLINYATRILDFFKTKQVKAVVIACNTSSALAYESIKDKYPFKIYPIIQSCASIISKMNLPKIGVFATTGTVNSNAYKKEINKFNPNIEVKEIACPKWVSIVEGVEDFDINLDVKSKLSEMLSFNPDKIILGCTHYPYLLETLTEFISKDLFIDPADIFVEFIKNDILKNSSRNIGKEEFFVSAYPEKFIENAKLFYKIDKTPIVY